MKILIAVHHFPPRFNGGAELRAYRTTRALLQRGHTVRVLCVERIDGGPEQGLQWNSQHSLGWEDSTYEGVEVRRLYFDRRTAPDLFRWDYNNPWVGDHVEDYLGEWQPDLLHLIGGYLVSGSVLAAAAATGTSAVVTLTDYWFLCARLQMLRSNGEIATLPIQPARCARCLAEEQRRYRLPGRLFPGLVDAYWQGNEGAVQRIESRLEFLLGQLNHAEIIISPSHFLRSAYIQAGVQPEKIVFSRQGHDFPDLQPDLLEKSPSDQLRLGYIGQIAEVKGVHVLFEALKHLPGVRVVVQAYGDSQHFPNYTRRLQRLVDRDPRLMLAGPYQRQEISQVFHNLDVIVMPSLWYENSPNVILEAFAHRTPVIASRLGGMAELVEHNENGLLFEPGDPSDLARQIRRLIAEPGLVERLCQGIRPVRSLRQEIDELESIYRRAVKQTQVSMEI